MTTLSKRQRDILTKLTDGERWREDEIKSSFSFLQNMYFEGWLDGGAYEDSRGFGNFPRTRIWWITEKGREALT